MSSKKEVVIIGGGVCGCSIAYHLAKQGVPSQIIERDAIASQASGKAWAVISAPARILLFFEDAVVPRGSMRPCLSFFEEGFQQFPHLAVELKEEGGVDIGYGELPCLSVTSQESEESYLKKRVSELASEGFEVGWLGGDEVKARISGITPGVRGGVFFPGQQVEPYKYVLSLFQAAEKMGASIKQGEAVRFRYQGSRVTAVILATGAEVDGDVVVLAMGPWSGQGTSWLGKEIPLIVRREQCLKVEVPQRLPLYRLLTNQVAIIPKVNGTVILGCAGAHEEVVANFDDRPTEETKTSIMSAAVALLPKLEEAKLVEHRAGLESWQPNGGLPMLGRLPGWDNVYLATWLATWGIQWSPAVGRVMADLIIKGRFKESVEPLSPARLL